MKALNLTILILFTTSIYGQKTYVSRDQTHLCGPIEIAHLEQAPYGEWFKKYYDFGADISEKQKWSKKLKDVKVDIYLGTWCGDSKKWVPQFVKIWDELGLDRDQLNFIALYNTEGKHKQGPNGEEIGKKIFRVPTFIFEKNNAEIGRIVEFPATNFKIDLAQIASGFPPAPSYQAANYLLNLFEDASIDEINENINPHYSHLYKRVKRSAELNSLGYLLMGKDALDQALVVFRLNTYLFRTDANVFDSYGEALFKAEKFEESLVNYEKAVKMDPNNENAVKLIAQIKAKIDTNG